MYRHVKYQIKCNGMSNCKQRPYNIEFSVTFDRTENTAILQTNNTFEYSNIISFKGLKSDNHKISNK